MQNQPEITLQLDYSRIKIVNKDFIRYIKPLSEWRSKDGKSWETIMKESNDKVGTNTRFRVRM
jgi:hypothetical protein